MAQCPLKTQKLAEHFVTLNGQEEGHVEAAGEAEPQSRIRHPPPRQQSNHQWGGGAHSQAPSYFLRSQGILPRIRHPNFNDLHLSDEPPQHCALKTTSTGT